MAVEIFSLDKLKIFAWNKYVATFYLLKMKLLMLVFLLYPVSVAVAD